MYADDLVSICETKEEARQRFVAWRNALLGVKVNISKTKVMMCASDPCSVCGKRVGVNSVYCASCGYWVHGRCSGVQGSLKRVAQGLCAKCVELKGDRQLMSFASKMLS